MITQEQLKELLHYNPDTGIFTRLTSYKHFKVGMESGCINGHGYLSIYVKGSSIYAHRLAWLYTHGSLPDEDIDHINHNRTDNRIVNLRCVSRIENGRNMKASTRNSSGHVGVSLRSDNGKWRARISDNYKIITLGTFKTMEEAIRARKDGEVKYGYHENNGSFN
jgi:hypothetical protein